MSAWLIAPEALLGLALTSAGLFSEPTTPPRDLRIRLAARLSLLCGGLLLLAMAASNIYALAGIGR